MKTNSLETFIQEIQKVWGPLATETVENSRRLMEALVKSSPGEEWSADLLGRASQELNEELYRDATHGFMLMAHSENEGRYRIPHNHGSGWVIYAVLGGEVEMRTYNPMVTPKGQMQVVRKDSYRMKAGDCKVYLPGDIHDTRCISKNVVMLRLTSCDLKVEDREGRLIRYVEAGKL